MLHASVVVSTGSPGRKGFDTAGSKDLLGAAAEDVHDPSVAVGLNTPRLDDDNEFPPVTHHADIS